MCDRCAALSMSRRGLFGSLAAAALVAAGPAPASTVTGDEALRRLVAGNAHYVSKPIHARDYSVGRADRVGTQRPFASILSCSDSRVSPEFVFDQGPGDLFVVR